MKEVFAQHLNCNVKLGGRLKPLADCPHLKLGRYLHASIAPPPVSTNYRAKSMAALRRMYCNDALGCCTVTAKAHLKGQVTGNADGGTPVQFPDTQIKSWYSAITGWNPNDPSTDRGANMQAVLNWFTKNGYGPGTQKPLGWVSVDLTNPQEVMQAVNLFEGTDVGGDLPDTAVKPLPGKDGEWNFSGPPDPENGHDFPVVDYDSTGVYVATWALIMHIRWADFGRIGSKASGGEGYILIDPDMINKANGRAANGLALGDLISDFDKLYGGTVPIPAPAPVPVPPPLAGGVSLAQAEAAVQAAFATQPYIIGRDAATATATKALAGITGWPK